MPLQRRSVGTINQGEPMAKTAQKSKFFRVATEGATTDGRAIQREHLQQMAKNYDPAKYGARIFIEHIRGLNPEWGFRCMGDVLALRNGEVELDGKTLTTLEAQIAPTDEFVALTRAGQKIYSSIEIAPNFAGSGEAYLFGLGVTDSPASLGTDVLKFAAQHPEASPLAARKQAPDNLFSEAVEVEIELEEVAGPSLLDRIKGLFKAQRADDAARFADVHAAVEEVAGLAVTADQSAERAGIEVHALQQAFADYRTTTDAALAEINTRLDNTPAPDPAPTRSPATGRANTVLTDC